MVNFFIDYYKRTLSGDLRILIEAVYSLSKNKTDPTLQSDWNNAATKALQKQAIEKPLDETIERRLTKLQAFNAMVKLAEGYYKETASDFMGGLLGSLLFLSDGVTADPAFWSEWDDAINKVLQNQNSEKYVDEVLGISVTESQAFKAMVQFFKDYYKRGPELGIVIFFDYLHLLSEEKPGTREYLTLGGS